MGRRRHSRPSFRPSKSKMRNLPTLPDEIIAEIISWLPAKSFGRCKCLSKYWKARISELLFIRTHIERSRKRRQESLLVYSHAQYDDLYYASLNDANAHQMLDKITVDAKIVSFSPDHEDSWRWVYGSCDGLVLALDSQNLLFLLNPVTKQIKHVPPSPLFPNHEFLICGVGYDSFKQDYMVVVLSYSTTDDENEGHHDSGNYVMFVDVWSMDFETWKRVNSPPLLYHAGLSLGAFVGGCIHWLVIRVIDAKTVILAFDVAEETFHEMPVPRAYTSERSSYGCQSGFGGCLCIVNERDLWVMREYGVEDSWTKISINVAQCYTKCFLDHEKMLIRHFGKLVIRNLEMGSNSKKVLMPGIQAGFYYMCSFVESLISPYGYE